MAMTLQAQTSYNYRYWFDSSPQAVTASGDASVTLDLDVAGLPQGIHSLNAFAVDSNGVPSSVVSQWFLKAFSPIADNDCHVVLHVDGKQHSVRETTLSPEGLAALDVDFSDIKCGVHTIGTSVVTKENVSTDYKEKFFYRFPTTTEMQSFDGYYILDGMTTGSVKGGHTGSVLLDIDLASLQPGVHVISVFMATPLGYATNVHNAYFYKVPTSAEMESFDGYYVIDGKETRKAKAGRTGLVNLDLDVADLPTGFHSVALLMATPLGYATNMHSAYFYKIPPMGEGVQSYRWWLNEQSADAQLVTLDRVTDPFSLIAMLNVPSIPFRSRDFALDTSGGKLTLYARNALNFESFDGEGKRSFSQSDFTDVRVSRNLEKSAVTGIPEGIGRLETSRPSQNDIKWYSFSGEPGGNLRLSVDKGCMIDVFDKDGERILRKEGADATATNDVSLRKDGTYYIALHDFEKNAKKVNLSYTLMNRNCVVSHTPERSANSGRLYVNLDGNGMNELKSVRLSGNGLNLVSEGITVNDNFQASARFELDNAPLGKLDVIAEYQNGETGATETVTVKDALTLETANPKAVTATIIPSQRGGSEVYDVVLRLQNDGNVPYWGIPVNIASQNSDNDYALIYTGFYTEADSVGNGLRDNSLKTSNLLNTGKEGSFESFLLPYIGPDETIDLTLGLVADAHERVKIYAWAGDAWSLETEEMMSPGYDFTEVINWPQTNIMSLKALVCADLWLQANQGISHTNKPQKAPGDQVSAPPSWFDPDHHNFPHSPGLSGAADNADRVANISQAIGMTIASIFNGGDVNHDDALAKSLGYQGVDDPQFRSDFSSASQLSNAKRQAMYHPHHIIATAFGHGDEYEMMTGYQNGCPQSSSPYPQPNDVEMLGACDPNDMLGYVAPGGGNYVGLDVKTLGYTIEFENDPELANAPALTVKVHNKLDGRFFDLDSFIPQEITIGNHKVDVPATHEWVRTIDMRPEINGVAQVSFRYDAATGDANWEIISLDPMTMERTDVINQGFLPVNNEDGDGTGFMTYSVRLKENLAHGTEISNKAEIIFDSNEVIETPVYVNVTDYKRPSSHIVRTDTEDDQTFTFTVEGTDTDSGIWYYDLYMRTGNEGEWTLVGGNYEENTFSYTTAAPIEHAQFMVVACDRAGNMQEGTLIEVVLGDADGNGVVNANDAVIIRNYYVGKTDVINAVGADASGDGKINAQDALAVRTIYLGKQKIKELNKLRKRKK